MIARSASLRAVSHRSGLLLSILLAGIGAPSSAVEPIWAGSAGGMRMLYAPSESDDPTYRAWLAEGIGGTCDYLDARLDTPSEATLSEYDCVHTFSNHPYLNPALFGDRLADFVDAGGVVILGAYAASQAGNGLAGRLMERGQGYVPFTSLAANSVMSAWDGTCREDCIYTNVPGFYAVHRETVTVIDPAQGSVCGRYVDGEIAVAFNNNRRVCFVNGSAGYPLLVDPSIARVVANACLCRPVSVPTGACCLANPNRCEVLPAAECEAQKGSYQGDGTACEPDPCPPSLVIDSSWGRIKAQHR